MPQDNADATIGDRAFSNEPDVVAALGDIVIKSLMAGGILPIIKHIPGHGRATVDSHKSLPSVDTPLEVLREHDFMPFKALNDAPYAMTAHITYTALDKNAPVTFSQTVIGDIIRGELGFSGLLMSDDLSMKALEGSYGAKALRSIEAGCDLVIHCNGNMEEMVEIASVLPHLSEDICSRTDSWLDEADRQPLINRERCEQQYNELMTE